MESEATSGRRVVVSPEQLHTYRNKHFGRHIRFTPAAHEVVVTFHPPGSGSAPSGRADGGPAPDAPVVHDLGASAAAVDLDAHAAAMRAVLDGHGLAPRWPPDPARCWAVARVPGGRTADDACEALRDAREVANALPALVDDRGLVRYVLPDEVAVRFAPDLSREACGRIIAEAGSHVIRAGRWTPGYYVLAVPDGAGLFATLRRLSERDDVDFAEPCEIDATGVFAPPAASWPPSSAKRFRDQWGLDNTGQAVTGSADTGNLAKGRSGVDVGARAAWQDTTGDPAVVAVVMDQGFQIDDEEAYLPGLRKAVLPQQPADHWFFGKWFDTEARRILAAAKSTKSLGEVTPEELTALAQEYKARVTWPVPPEAPGDRNPNKGHADHIAGTIVAAADTVGIAPACRLLPLFVTLSNLDASDGADTAYWRVEAFGYLLDRIRRNPAQRHVVNCSWGTVGEEAGLHVALQAMAKGSLVVFAAGNDRRDVDTAPRYPAAWPEVMSVAAVDNRNVRWSDSNHGDSVDVSAPGRVVWSLDPADPAGYGARNGTSYAAPHVVGAAALVWSLDRQLGGFTLAGPVVRRILEDSCDPVDADSPAFAGKLGRGRIRADLALRRARVYRGLLGGVAFPGRGELPPTASGTPVALPGDAVAGLRTAAVYDASPTFEGVPAPADVRLGALDSGALLAALLAIVSEKPAEDRGSPPGADAAPGKGALRVVPPGLGLDARSWESADPVGAALVLGMTGPGPGGTTTTASVRLFDPSTGKPSVVVVDRLTLRRVDRPTGDGDVQAEGDAGWVRVLERAAAAWAWDESTGSRGPPSWDALKSLTADRALRMLLGAPTEPLDLGTGEDAPFPALTTIETIWGEGAGARHYEEFEEAMMIAEPEPAQEALVTAWDAISPERRGGASTMAGFLGRATKGHLSSDAVRTFAEKAAAYLRGTAPPDPRVQDRLFAALEACLREGRPVVATTRSAADLPTASSSTGWWKGLLPDHHYAVLAVARGAAARQVLVRSPRGGTGGVRSPPGSPARTGGRDSASGTSADPGASDPSSSGSPSTSASARLPPPAWYVDRNGTRRTTRPASPELWLDLADLFLAFRTVVATRVPLRATPAFAARPAPGGRGDPSRKGKQRQSPS